VPGVQGVSWVKFLRRVEVGDQPYATKDETVHYVDLMPDGQHRQYTSIQECKSVVTTPSGGQVLLDKEVTVPESTSVGVPLPRTTRYARLTAAGPGVVAGFSVTTGGSVATAGVSSALRSVLRPVIRPGW
jgi:hypothetical protein